MKRIIYLLLLFPFICFGQVPQSMSYQAMATNSEGFEIANSQISVQISIIEETPSGLVSFVEGHTVTTDAYGMFSINIGQGNTEDDYTAVDWSKSNFLKVELDDNMDGAYSLMGVSAFNSVPYSYMAENVMNPDELKDNLGDHTATQTLDMDSNFVSQVMAPELPLDAANKQYVDDMIGDITTGTGEILIFDMINPNDLVTFNNCPEDPNYLCKILYIVPNGKIVFSDYRVLRIRDNSTSTQADLMFYNSYRFDNYSAKGGSTQHDFNIGTPGDTVVVNLNDYFEAEGDKLSAVLHQYTVSETQIDDNTTSYSMVSLDDGASSSGGTITEGTGGSSSQGGYMISEVNEISVDLITSMSYCSNLEESGYHDWFLPSIDDLLHALSLNYSDLSTNTGNVWTKTPKDYSGSNSNSWLNQYYVFDLGDFGRYFFDANTIGGKTICVRKD